LRAPPSPLFSALQVEVYVLRKREREQGSLTKVEGSVQLTSWYNWVNITCFLKLKILFTYSTKQATLMRRSIVLSLPFQLVFRGERERERGCKERR
jgi:hypothetical protein